MIVIEHTGTGGRFRYPSHNTNQETEDGFIQTQFIPREFKLSDNQDPSDIPDYHTVFTAGERWPVENDPIDQYNWRDKI